MQLTDYDEVHRLAAQGIYTDITIKFICDDDSVVSITPEYVEKFMPRILYSIKDKTFETSYSKRCMMKIGDYCSYNYYYRNEKKPHLISYNERKFLSSLDPSTHMQMCTATSHFGYTILNECLTRHLCKLWLSMSYDDIRKDYGLKNDDEDLRNIIQVLSANYSPDSYENYNIDEDAKNYNPNDDEDDNDDEFPWQQM